MVGKTLKSKINGNIFFVKGLRTENGKQCYIVCEVKTGKPFTIEKGWFEKGYMQNLEVIE